MFDWLKNSINTWLGTDEQYINYRIPQLIHGKGFELSQAEKISTVYTCIDILSKTLAKLPLEKYIENQNGKEKDKNSYLYSLLHYNVNSYTTSQVFIQTMEVIRNLKGNAFALINRNSATGKAESFKIINTSQVVKYKIINNQLYYFIQLDLESDTITPVHSHDVLHFKGISKDGIWGLNPIEALRMNLSTTKKGLQTIDTFYDNNATAPKAIKSTVSGANQSKMIEAVKLFESDYSGSLNSGKMLVLPPNTEIQDLALSFVDAEFISTLKFNANQIASLYGVPAHMVGNTEASKFNNVEQMNIGFKGETISPNAKMYRQEFEFKLLTAKQRIDGESIEFNLNAMIETDYTTRMNGYKQLVSSGSMSPNDVCRIENLPTDPDGDVRMVPMNMMALEKLTKQDINTKNNNGSTN
jgi:HK97 family phage portal protein